MTSGAGPSGHYLSGVVVGPWWRRRGIGTLLTTHRIEAAWAAGADTVYYFANSRNEASIAMHLGFGFRELRRPFAFPGVTFTGGEGVLFGLTRSLPDQPRLALTRHKPEIQCPGAVADSQAGALRPDMTEHPCLAEEKSQP